MLHNKNLIYSNCKHGCKQKCCCPIGPTGPIGPVGQIGPGSIVPIRESNNPFGTGLLLIYVSRETTSTTELFRISSGDRILNCIPIILEGVLYSFILDFCEDDIII